MISGTRRRWGHSDGVILSLGRVVAAAAVTACQRNTVSRQEVICLNEMRSFNASR